MSVATSESVSYSWSTADIEKVTNRFRADIVMIAQSSGAITEACAHEYAHDVNLLAKGGYLKFVDLTLLSSGVEVRAVKYYVNTDSEDLIMSRPGGVRWPKVVDPYFRIVLSYSSAFTESVRQEINSKLKRKWVSTNANTSHSTLISTGGRNYASNGWGMGRKDFGE